VSLCFQLALGSSRGLDIVEMYQPRNFGSIDSSNVPYDCNFNGQKMCCSLIQDPHRNLRDKKAHSIERTPKHKRCSTERIYMSFPYELKHIEMAKTLSAISYFKDRRRLLFDFITSQEEVNNSNTWLKRVQLRMNNSTLVNELATEDDYKFLSRFKATKYCYASTRKNIIWDEYIEPISIHARNPFSVSNCENQDVKDLFSKRKNYSSALDIVNVDYILTQSGASFDNNTNPGQKAGDSAKRFL
jgi:hypothetical protein